MTVKVFYGKDRIYYLYGRERYGSLARGMLSYFIFDHQGSLRVDYSLRYDATTKQLTYTANALEDYYAFGKVLRSFESAGPERFMYTGKERDRELSEDYFGARKYDPDVCLWTTRDPWADKFPRWSPYGYGFNNPLRFIDPTGMGPYDVIITGDKATEAFQQLQKSTSLKLKMEENGKVTASGEAKTEADKTLLEAINSKMIDVHINATNSNYTDWGTWYVGGAFGGSKINSEGKIITNQTVNPEMTKNIDEFYGAPLGVSVLHEVIESYIGGKDSPGIGTPTYGQEDMPDFKGYLKAHNRAEAIDPRHYPPYISKDDTGVYISKFPIDCNIPSSLNPEMLINNLKK